jgi:predicted nucleic acid-binding protein
MPIVIDANIAIAWFRPSGDALADAALDELCEHGAIVPALWRWEVQDVLRRLHAGGRLTISFESAIAEMVQLPITVDDQRGGLFGTEASLSQKYGVSLYDAAYLEVALRNDSLLATRDKKLLSAAKAAGVSF